MGWQKFWSEGKEFASDLESGGWYEFSYQVNFSSGFVPDRNWFSYDEFWAEVENYVNKNGEVLSEKWMGNKTNEVPWHFSHLGEDLFLEIADLICEEESFDVPIEKVYIGASGEPYAKKAKNRNVNLNWAVILQDGKEFKCGPKTKNIPEEGLWNRSNCREFEWEEIKKYFISHSFDR